MKTFLDLQATDLTLKVELVLVPVGQPQVSVNIGQHSLTKQLTDTITITNHMNLTSAFAIDIALLEKNYNDPNETAVMIQSLTIDDFEIVPSRTHLAHYINDHDYADPTNYLGFVGIWRLEIDCAFYQWRHKSTNQGWLLKP
jgi:hypothetical protein